jgi:hypothetical protein
MYIPTSVIFNGVRKCPEFGDGLSPGSVVEISDSGYVNEVLFLLWWIYSFSDMRLPFP